MGVCMSLRGEKTIIILQIISRNREHTATGATYKSTAFPASFAFTADGGKTAAIFLAKDWSSSSKALRLEEEVLVPYRRPSDVAGRPADAAGTAAEKQTAYVVGIPVVAMTRVAAEATARSILLRRVRIFWLDCR